MELAEGRRLKYPIRYRFISSSTTCNNQTKVSSYKIKYGFLLLTPNFQMLHGPKLQRKHVIFVNVVTFDVNCVHFTRRGCTCVKRGVSVLVSSLYPVCSTHSNQGAIMSTCIYELDRYPTPVNSSSPANRTEKGARGYFSFGRLRRCVDG